MKVETHQEMQLHGDRAIILVHVFVDGLSCGSVVVLAGPRDWVEPVWRGEVALGDAAPAEA